MKIDCKCSICEDKAKHSCTVCGKKLCGKHIYFYVDGNNIAITRNAKGHCPDCYKIKYPRG